MDLIEVASTPQGVAFEVPVKKADAAAALAATPVRKRLEQRAAGEEPLPRLLGFSRTKEPATEWESPVKIAAARAKTANEKKREVADRVRSEKDLKAVGARTSLEDALRRAEEKRSSSMAEKITRAGKHFEDVKLKADGCNRASAEAAQERERKLREAIEQKAASHAAGVSSRVHRAGQHNGHVAERLVQHSAAVAKRAGELREKLNSKACRQPVRKPTFYVEPKFVKGKGSEGTPVDLAADAPADSCSPCDEIAAPCQ